MVGQTVPSYSPGDSRRFSTGEMIMNNRIDPFNISGFNREFQRIDEFIDNIKSGAADFLFLNFFTPEDEVKYYLLARTWQKYERIIPMTLVRLRDYTQDNGDFQLSKLLLKIVQDLSERLPRRIVDLPTDYERISNEVQLAELLIHLVENAREVEKAIVLLVDGYDSMPANISRWFEGAVLGPLVRTRRVGAIFSSNFELVFNDEFDLRMRLDRHEVSGLSADDISRSYPEYQGIASEIYLLTGGMMKLTSGFVEALKNSQITVSTFHEYQQELMQRYYHELVEQIILPQYEPKVQETLLVLAILRRFDIRVLEYTLPKVMPHYYDNSNMADYYIELIKSLDSNVQWRAQGGYTLRQALRMVLHGYALFKKPELYKNVNLAAINLYRELLHENYREYYLLELIYHEVILHRFDKGYGLFPIQEKVGKELEDYLNGESAALVREEDLDLLRNWLKNDPDLEMYINEEAIKSIDRQIRVRIYEYQVAKKMSNQQDKLLDAPKNSSL